MDTDDLVQYAIISELQEDVNRLVSRQAATEQWQRYQAERATPEQIIETEKRIAHRRLKQEKDAHKSSLRNIIIITVLCGISAGGSAIAAIQSSYNSIPAVTALMILSPLTLALMFMWYSQSLKAPRLRKSYCWQLAEKAIRAQSRTSAST